jgi:hypothetical protein
VAPNRASRAECPSGHTSTEITDLAGFCPGYPYDPSASDADILHRLVQSFDRCDDLFEKTEPLGGRWILIADDGREVRLFNDATGLRQVFHTVPGSGYPLWCGSQTGIIAEILDLEMDQEAG